MADQGTEGLLSPFLRGRRFKAAMPFLKGRILDVGCGTGALAELIDPASYVGVEVDETSLKRARNHLPQHSFLSALPSESEKFDTVVSLAVIEHVQDPSGFLESLARYLNKGPDACIVVTTPHPSADWIHFLGASAGLFSKHANDEHEDLLDRGELYKISESIGLVMVKHARFLFSVNQLAVFKQDR